MRRVFFAVLLVIGMVSVFFSNSLLASEQRLGKKVIISYLGMKVNAIEFTVQPGDTLGEMCLYILGDYLAYEMIAHDNGIKDANHIRPGQKIRFLVTHRVGYTDEEGRVGHTVWNIWTLEDNKRIVQNLKRMFPYWQGFFIDTPTETGLLRDYVE